MWHFCCCSNTGTYKNQIVVIKILLFQALLLFFIIKGFWTIVFIFIVIFKSFQPICPPAFFRCLSNSGNFTELRTTSLVFVIVFTILWQILKYGWDGKLESTMADPHKQKTRTLIPTMLLLLLILTLYLFL